MAKYCVLNDNYSQNAGYASNFVVLYCATWKEAMPWEREGLRAKVF